MTLEAVPDLPPEEPKGKNPRRPWRVFSLVPDGTRARTFATFDKAQEAAQALASTFSKEFCIQDRYNTVGVVPMLVEVDGNMVPNPVAL